MWSHQLDEQCRFSLFLHREDVFASTIGLYSSESNFPKVGLCLRSFRDSLSVGMRCTGGGMPIASRAIDFTALVALNLFFFLRGAMESGFDLSTTALCNNRVLAAHKGRRQLEEREMFEEKDQRRSHTLTCPHCRQAGEYELSWLVRTKKRQLPPRADDRDRAKFAKARSYMVRKDDMVACKNVRCRKRFEVAGIQSVAFLE
jgi:hypothetical protein